jgi:very-short-patch-repair endonuclease
LAVEFDGYMHHGRCKEDFQRDRERQNLLTLNGWRILRFTARDYYRNTWRILDLITKALASSDAP